MKKWECTVCGYIYDPAVGDPDGGVAPGTPFEDLPEDWVCCKAAMFGSYGWSGGVLRHLKRLIEPLKWELVDALEFNGHPTDEDLRRGEGLGLQFAQAIKQVGE